MIRILLYSCDSRLHSLLTPALGLDFQLRMEWNREALKQSVASAECEVVLLDLDSTHGMVEEQMKLYHEVAQCAVAAVAMADDEARASALELMDSGLHGHCRKPPAVRELKALLRRASEHTLMRRELDASRTPAATHASIPEAACDQMIGSSEPMRRVYDLVARVTNLNASVLITGESGTGKELIARAIHNRGSRANLPFVPVSCGAIPETLIESELFGHEKGAFTGSTGTRCGYLEQAGAGTLFLDEIGELSLHTQVKLLRVLQQREFTRLGSSRPIPLKARVIFATHRNLQRMVDEGKFRLDLYYRINVMTIRAPRLAEHPEDIALLAHHFAKQYAELYNKDVQGIAPRALRLLEQYHWPGNVRELENLIQGAIIHADEGAIHPHHLHSLQETDVPDEEEAVATVGRFERLLHEYKVKLACRAIEECGGNKTLAARNLHISRAYLHRLIKPEDTVDAFRIA